MKYGERMTKSPQSPSNNWINRSKLTCAYNTSYMILLQRSYTELRMINIKKKLPPRYH